MAAPLVCFPKLGYRVGTHSHSPLLLTAMLPLRPSHTSLLSRRASQLPKELAGFELSPHRVRVFGGCSTQDILGVLTCVPLSAQVIFGEEIARGRFGSVLLGAMQAPNEQKPRPVCLQWAVSKSSCSALFVPIQVIIKMCSTRSSSEQSRFSAMLTTMSKYNVVNHPNVRLGIMKTKKERNDCGTHICLFLCCSRSSRLSAWCRTSRHRLSWLNIASTVRSISICVNPTVG